jgi:hypothetical protein
MQSRLRKRHPCFLLSETKQGSEINVTVFEKCLCTEHASSSSSFAATNHMAIAIAIAA